MPETEIKVEGEKEREMDRETGWFGRAVFERVLGNRKD